MIESFGDPPLRRVDIHEVRPVDCGGVPGLLEIDPVRDDGEAYAERLRHVGVPASVSRYDGMFHAFVSFAEFLDDGRRAIREAGGALRAALDS